MVNIWYECVSTLWLFNMYPCPCVHLPMFMTHALLLTWTCLFSWTRMSSHMAEDMQRKLQTNNKVILTKWDWNSGWLRKCVQSRLTSWRYLLDGSLWKFSCFLLPLWGEEEEGLPLEVSPGPAGQCPAFCISCRYLSKSWLEEQRTAAPFPWICSFPPTEGEGWAETSLGTSVPSGLVGGLFRT